jgi:hypothetical protein
MEGRPVQRRGLVSPPGGHGPDTVAHEPNDVGLIVARRMRHHPAVGFVQACAIRCGIPESIEPSWLRPITPERATGSPVLETAPHDFTVLARLRQKDDEGSSTEC